MKRSKISTHILVFIAWLPYLQGQYDMRWEKLLQERTPQTPKCGIKGSIPNQNEGTSSRVINGRNTTNKEYPWVAQVTLYMPHLSIPGTIQQKYSTGTIISNRAILTCQHCICKADFQDLTKLDSNTCLRVPFSTYVENQNRVWHEGGLLKANIVRYYIGTSSAPEVPPRSTPEFPNEDALRNYYQANIEAYLYEYDPDWNVRVINRGYPLVGRNFYTGGDIALIVDINGLLLKPNIASPICLPDLNSFRVDNPLLEERGIDVILAGRGYRYEQYEDTANQKKHSTCFTNEGVARKPGSKFDGIQHNFLPCKDYWREKDNKPNRKICIPISRALVNHKRVNVANFKSMSIRSKVTFSSGVSNAAIYSIIPPNGDKCNTYWEKAQEAYDDLEESSKIDVVGDSVDELPDRILVLDPATDEAVEECYNYVKLASGGVCRTEIKEYPWGFCSPSCSGRAVFGVQGGIKTDTMDVDELLAQYHDSTDHNSITGMAVLPNGLGGLGG